MLKVGVQKCGTNWRVILKGDANEIETKHWSMYNHGATRAELDWETETCAHFWSTPTKILKAFTNAHLYALLGQADAGLRDFKNKKGGAMPLAQARAQKEFDEMESIPKFKPFHSVSIINLDCFAIGSTNAENLDSDA